MPPLPVRKTSWVPASCEVKGGHKGWLMVRLEGYRLGPLFVTAQTEATGADPVIGKDVVGWFVLCVVSTGHQLLSCRQEAQVRKAAELLLADRQVRLALEAVGRGEIRKAMPSWVKPWCRACTEAGVCVDPGPYQTF